MLRAPIDGQRRYAQTFKKPITTQLDILIRIFNPFEDERPLILQQAVQMVPVLLMDQLNAPNLIRVEA